MRKVVLSMKAQEKYDVIKRLAEGHISIKTAAVKIGCTERHVRRLLNTYRAKGKAAFVHGNTGRKPVHAFSEPLKREIVSLYNNKYWDTNFTHCCELLRRNDSIQISPSSLRKRFGVDKITFPRPELYLEILLLILSVGLTPG